MPVRRIRVLGAPGTGKTQLAAELTAALSAENHPALRFAIDDNPPLPLPRPATHASGLTLLMGLDLPAQRTDRRERETSDRVLRDALARSGMAYQVVYGHGVERLRNALQALHAWLPGHPGLAAAAERPAQPAAGWVWACDNCSDPQCERRLLSDLLAARIGPAGAP